MYIFTIMVITCITVALIYIIKVYSIMMVKSMVKQVFRCSTACYDNTVSCWDVSEYTASHPPSNPHIRKIHQIICFEKFVLCMQVGVLCSIEDLCCILRIQFFTYVCTCVCIIINFVCVVYMYMHVRLGLSLTCTS